jgi:hypothetical protein
VYHRKCLTKIIEETVGEYTEFISIKKSNFLDIESSTENIMVLSDRIDKNIICCIKCGDKYSILSPIFRDYKIPKLIECIIVFFGLDDRTSDRRFYHHLDKSSQQNIFEDFDYELEDSLIKEEYDLSIIEKIYEMKEYENHCVIHLVNNKYVIKMEPVSCCHVCNKSEDDVIKYMHGSVEDYCKYVYDV